MAATDRDDPRRSEALQHLEHFATTVLPGTVRRIAAWKRIPLGAIADLMQEVQQELAVDCLEHAALITSQAPPERHARWMREAERCIYRCWTSGARVARDPDAEPAPAPPRPPLTDLLRAPDLIRMRNGRCNFTAIARRSGRHTRAVRQELEFLADTFAGRADVGFWRERLGEALTGLAADLLRDRGQVRLLHPPRQRPDPGARLRRLRRLGARFQVRPSTLTIRRVLAHWVRRPDLGDEAPRRLLEHATELCPWQVGTWLWLFEARFANGDHRGAAAALRQSRQTTRPPRAAVVLARARLLEGRRRWDAALALLRRACRRWPGERSLRLALGAMGPTPPPP